MEKGLKTSRKKLIHSICRHNQYWSKAYVKGDLHQIGKTVRRIPSEASMHRLLQGNIEMRVGGLRDNFAEFICNYLVSQVKITFFGQARSAFEENNMRKEDRGQHANRASNKSTSLDIHTNHVYFDFQSQGHGYKIPYQRD